jgi:hypothetical protein
VGPLSLVSTIEELLERKSSGSGLENREYVRRDPSRWPRGILYPQKLTLTSPTSGGRSVGIVRSRTQTTEFVLFVCLTGRQYFCSCGRLKARQAIRAVTLAKMIPKYEGAYVLKLFNSSTIFSKGQAMLLELYRFLCCLHRSVVLSVPVMKAEGLTSANTHRLYCRTYWVFRVVWLAKWLRAACEIWYMHFTTDMCTLTSISRIEPPKNHTSLFELCKRWKQEFRDYRTQTN